MVSASGNAPGKRQESGKSHVIREIIKLVILGKRLCWLAHFSKMFKRKRCPKFQKKMKNQQNLEITNLALKQNKRGKGSRSRATRRKNKKLQKAIEEKCNEVRNMIKNKNFAKASEGLDEDEIEDFDLEVDYLTAEISRTLRKVERDVSEKFQVEAILKTVMQRMMNGNGWQYNMMYEVKWIGYEATTFEPVEELEDNAAVDVFWQKQKQLGNCYKVSFIDYSSE